MLRLKINLKAENIAIVILSLFLWSGCEFNPTKTDITEDYNAITWTQNRELTNGNIHCLAENPQGDLFCGSDQNVYKSTDGGASWEVSSDINNTIYSIVCVTNNVMFASTLTDIYKSSDNGKTWTHWKAIMMDNCWIEKMVVYDEYWILVATSGRGLLKMSVQGRSWEQLQTASDYFNNIFIDPDNHDIIYACNAAGAERSDDGGLTWSRAGFPDDVYPKTNCMLKLSDSVLIAGSNFVDYGQSSKMFKSTDNGLNWEVMEITGENLGTGISSMVQIDNDRIYAGFSLSHDYGEKCGVYYSDDEGKSWTDAMNYSVPVADLLLSNDNEIYAATWEGIFKSENGTSWTAINDGIVNVGINDILITDTNKKYYATDRGLYLYNANDLQLVDLEYFDGANPRVLYQASDGTILMADNSRMYRYSGNGWSRSNWDKYSYLTHDIDGDNAGNIVCGTMEGVILSTDAGNTWQVVALSDAYYSFTDDIMMTLDGDIYATVKYTENDGLFRSKDLGQNWEKVTFFDDYDVTFLEKYKAKILFVGTKDKGLFISGNNGESWNKSGLDGNNIRSISCYNENLIVAGTNQGIFVSDNGGKDWRNESTGLTNNNITVVKIDKNNKLFAGTSQSGFFYSDGPLK